VTFGCIPEAFGLAHGEKRGEQAGGRNCAHIGSEGRLEDSWFCLSLNWTRSIRGGRPEAVEEATLVTGSGPVGIRVEACKGSCTEGRAGSASGACEIGRGTKQDTTVVWDRTELVIRPLRF
jgi:hypothetical protein